MQFIHTKKTAHIKRNLSAVIRLREWTLVGTALSAFLLPAQTHAADCSNVTSWSAGSVYTADVTAVRDATLFKAKWWTQGDDPLTHSGQWDVWASQGACDGSSSSTSSSSSSSSSLSSVSSSSSSSVSSSSSSASGDCASPQYVAGTTYSVNQLVQNAGNEYRCTIAGWCSSDAAWAYAPGTGAHWQDAWQLAGSCDVGSSSSSSSSSNSSSSSSSSSSSAGNSDRIISGYWHNFDNGSGVIPIADVSDAFDAINVSFAEPTGNAPGEIGFVLDPAFDEQAFRAGVAAKQAAGKKVIISIGGANGQVQLESASARTNFVNSMISIIDEYGFDGLDVDFEGHSLYLQSGDDDFRNPTTPVVTNLIGALQDLTAHYGSDFMLTMAPETFFVQLGYSFYGGTCAGCDTRAGAYLPVIYAMRDQLDWLQVQNYNSGPITGLDDQYHTMGVADFHVAMIDMLLTGFTIAGTNDFFPPLREDQVLLGLPANNNAGGGFTSVSDVHSALNCLIKLQGCGTYQPHTGTGWSDLRGVMTWSINWDKFNNFEFSTEHRQYLDSL
ncbi:glycosyl hydrolase family 18 protein [uncultured Gilvimarinus sp.]|uniref:chitinase n=1 Tax=uncultured Gilvimarinus sp. TaxID=1689143 RepID=UPI0030EF56A1|tara:strand:- start:925 stop:2586 length:1662 start_codon:yes stop_codon:yes gene_type:complete